MNASLERGNRVMTMHCKSNCESDKTYTKRIFSTPSFHLVLMHQLEHCQKCIKNYERFLENNLHLNMGKEESHSVQKGEIQTGIFNLIRLLVSSKVKNLSNKPERKPSKKKLIKHASKTRIVTKLSKVKKQKLQCRMSKEGKTPIALKKVTPRKGTLKRKRWIMKKLENNQDYEDDIYEGCKLYPFENTYKDADDEICNIATPKYAICLSPRQRCDSPVYEDCISLEELGVTRKEAEEYQYRRSKRRKTLMNSESKVVKVEDTEKEKLDISKTLEEASKAIAKQLEQYKKSESDDEEEKETCDEYPD